MKKLFVIVATLAIVVVLLTACGQQPRTNNPPGTKVCTQDAKLCPDGKTYVGRDPDNNCQFKPCPTTGPEPTPSPSPSPTPQPSPTPTPTPQPTPSGDSPEKPSFDFGQGHSNNLGSIGGQS